jgi:thioredoxin-related protein
MRKSVRWLALLALVAGMGLAGCESGQTQKSGDAPKQGPPPIPELTAAEKEKWGDHTQDLPFVIGYEKGLELARSHDKPAMMFVTTTWCGWCKRLALENFNDSEVQRLLASSISRAATRTSPLSPQTARSSPACAATGR